MNCSKCTLAAPNSPLTGTAPKVAGRQGFDRSLQGLSRASIGPLEVSSVLAIACLARARVRLGREEAFCEGECRGLVGLLR